MAIMLAETGPYDAIVARFMFELRHFTERFMYWVQHLTDGEKVVGLGLFAFVLMLLMVNNARKERSPGSSGRQFSAAIFLVVAFSFAAGWMLDPESIDLANLFHL